VIKGKFLKLKRSIK